MLLHELIFLHSRARPRATAIIETGLIGSQATYKELARRVDKLAHELSGLSLKKGERFGLLSKNSIGFVEVFFAVLRTGGVAVPLNYNLSSSDIMKIARHAGISGLYIGKGLEEKGEAIAKAVRSIRFVLGKVKTIKSKALPRRLRENDLAAIIYTSGTTGEPLGVCLRHRNLISSAKAIAGYVHLKTSDSICCVLPFYYIYGLSLLLSHVFAGGAVLVDNRFMYPNVVLDSIDKNKVTGFAGVASHYSILLDRTDFKNRRLKSIRYFMQAGDRMPEAMVKELIAAFPRKETYLMYGQTEASPRLAYLDPSSVRRKPGAIGKAVPGVELRIIDENRRECAQGEEGEIIARGDNIMLGYWRNPLMTKKALRGGWLYTGDIAYKDKDGDLFLVGRKKDFVKTAGHKVNPCKIAAIIHKHPGVLEVAVVGMTERLLGTTIKAFVVPKKGRKIKKMEIDKLCKINLPPYSVPSSISIIASIPKNALGKIDRERLVNLS